MIGDGAGLLRVQDLSKAFGGLQAVSAVSFAVAAGEILGLLGPNGSGKTTVFNLIAGALPADHGQVWFADHEITHYPPSARSALGIARTFQLVRVLPNLTAHDNVLVACLYGKGSRRPIGAARAEAARLLHLVGLDEQRATPAGTLTLHEGRRLEIARALGTRPRLLLLDEPLAGLNAAEVAATLMLFRDLQSQSITQVLVEHNVPAVRAVCDRMVVLNSGRKIAEGKPADVLGRPEVISVYLGTRARGSGEPPQ